MNYSRNFIILKNTLEGFSKDTKSTGRAIIEQRNARTRILISLQGIKQGEYISYVFTEGSYVNQWLQVSNKGRCDLNWELSKISADAVRAVCILTKDLQPILVGYTDKEFNWQKLLCSDKTEEVSVAEAMEETEENPQALKENLKEIITEFHNGIQELKQINNEDSSPFGQDDYVWQKADLRQLYNTSNLWKYANNPFVVHSYRCYHHIYLGKKDNCIALGVPCVYCKGYTLESQLQGFQEFKALKGQELKEGQLCYCIIKL